MIDRKFIDEWSNGYDVGAPGREKRLETSIENGLKRLFPIGRKVEYITREILRDIISWKAPRTIRFVDDNREEFIREVTKNAFRSPDEQFKVEGLTVLKGVNYRVATTILYFCFPSTYTIMDYRAWWTLQQKKELSGSYGIKDDFEHWITYLNKCREISCRCDCSLRRLDKALWKYSRDNQPKK